SVLHNTVHVRCESGLQFHQSDFITVKGNAKHNQASKGWFSGISIYQHRTITFDTSPAGSRPLVRHHISPDHVTKSDANTDGTGIII
ncbi:RTX toxin, partial [Rhizobium johnstonii]